MAQKMKIDWKNLGFQYLPTDSYLRADFRNGAWGELMTCTDPHLSLHVAATCLHYGQSCFEGLKAFSRKDGSVAIFRPEENARRLAASARRLVMEPLAPGLFSEACTKVLKHNIDWMPPYGTGASMYLRPILFGTSPHVGVHTSEEYSFLMLCMPVGPYYRDGFFPVKAMIQEKYDRAAPRGVGSIKAAGNYAAGMLGDWEGKQAGYPICLYLDSATRSCVDEFGTSNFIAITKDGRYVTPESSSILCSITNRSLQTLAADFGLRVESRNITVEELETFAEVGACGTAAVITPVCSITRGDKVYTFGKENEAGPTLTRLYKELQGIQYGEIDDRHRWMVKANI
ncbi:MAG: branched-chain amino acid aminotransferase [Chitinispirillaceae bacterium]|nr:branched-chain amino acid aminotransferase [Chitinispirillaceae bacterium]